MSGRGTQAVSASVSLTGEHGVAVLTLANPAKLNAMSRGMWRQLKQVAESIQASDRWRCVVLRGAGGHFCAGGDIAEYPEFRFDPASLRAFHEDHVWGGLSALLACDVPLIAAIEGHCMGAGVEIAACCDIRVAADDARFGAPIAKLGFPMAPREAALVARAVGDTTARELLLEAAVLGAPEMKARGFLNHVLPAADLHAHALARAARVAALAPQAARLNKQTFRALNAAQVGTVPSLFAIEKVVDQAYDYAPSDEHREGVAAFLEKRAARFAVVPHDQNPSP